MYFMEAVKYKQHNMIRKKYFMLVKKQKQKHKKRQNKGFDNLKNLGTPWSELPGDMLRVIGERLHYVDQVRFRAVCKSWLLPKEEKEPRGFVGKSQFPWLMTYSRTNWIGKRPYVHVEEFTCKLFDSTNAHNQKLTPYSVDNYYHPKYAQICACNHGWLLFSAEKVVLGHQTNSIFLLYPFTKKTIKLPDLNLDDLGHTFESRYIYRFSSDPNSSSSSSSKEGCIIFVLHLYHYSNLKMTISTCRLGDERWSTQVFDKNIVRVNDVTYVDGVFYCLCDSGILAAYNVSEKELRFVTDTKFITSEGSLLMGYRMIESNGELLLICVDQVACEADSSSGHCSVYSFDWSPGVMTWVPKTCLGNRALFISRKSSFSISAPHISNRIYFHDFNNTTKFYSLTDDQIRVCHTSEFRGVAGGELINNNDDNRTRPVTLWIQPPQFST